MSNLHEIEQVSLMNTGGFVEDGSETKASVGLGLSVLAILAVAGYLMRDIRVGSGSDRAVGRFFKIKGPKK